MEILVVEDTGPKQSKIVSFLFEHYNYTNIQVANSVRSAIGFLENENFDLMLLDMSLPTYDISAEETGGRPQSFGGMEVLRNAELLEIQIPTIVVTAYEAFVKGKRKLSLSGMDEELSNDHPDVYCGLVYYNSVLGTWEAELNQLIDRICTERPVS